MEQHEPRKWMAVLGWFLVILQFLAIFLLVFQFDSKKLTLLQGGIFLLSLVIGITAAATMKLSNLSIHPLPGETNQLVTAGIYRFIRHPMYLALIVFSTGIVLNIQTILSYLGCVILVLTLVAKAKIEEHYMISKHPNYQEYQKTSKAFIPFLL